MWHKFQVNYQTKKQYMMANVLKCRSNNTLLLCIFGLSNTIEVVV